jgi:hypothetical protein
MSTKSDSYQALESRTLDDLAVRTLADASAPRDHKEAARTRLRRVYRGPVDTSGTSAETLTAIRSALWHEQARNGEPVPAHARQTPGYVPQTD